jgi:hypothetical protein
MIAPWNEWRVQNREPETIEIAVCPNPTRSCLVPESLDGTHGRSLNDVIESSWITGNLKGASKLNEQQH